MGSIGFGVRVGGQAGQPLLTKVARSPRLPENTGRERNIRRPPNVILYQTGESGGRPPACVSSVMPSDGVKAPVPVVPTDKGFLIRERG